MNNPMGKKTQRSKPLATKKPPMVYLKEHFAEGCMVLAVCDENTLGKTFSSGRVTITVDPSFYQGDLVSIPTALEKINGSANSNLTGKKIIRAAIKAKLLDKDGILQIGKTAHAHRIII
ncbi:MAG: DUF424 domain-containing protein [Candidatus Ranarchaeia archaeon]|jgi:hypothetical protein